MEDKKSDVGKTLTAAAIGAVAGAAAVILTDKEKRQKISSKIDEERGRVELKAKEVKEKGRTKIIKGLEDAKSKLESMDEGMDDADSQISVTGDIPEKV